MVALGVAAMLFQGWLVSTSLLSLSENAASVPKELASPQNLFVIPGLNQFVPLSFAVVIALFLAMVMHEFAHGIFARMFNVPVKAMGFIIALIAPIGAFVDIADEDIRKESWMKQIAIYGMGPYVNIFCGVIVFFLILLALDLLKLGFIGFFALLVLPIDPMMGNHLTALHPLAIPYAGMPIWMHVIQTFFWFGWMSLMLGLSNLIPVLPLDGGYILRTLVERATARFHRHIHPNVVAAAIMIIFFLMYAISILWIAFFGK
jgi:Zn-dependent protease